MRRRTDCAMRTDVLRASVVALFLAGSTGQAAAIKYAINALSDQQTVPWGEVTLQFLSTPGHTPDGMCALVFGKSDKAKPLAILTGDTLFVGSIGRPDLMGGTMAASALAGMSYDTWVNKLAKLDDGVIVLPAHGAGSLCGANLRDEARGGHVPGAINRPFTDDVSKGEAFSTLKPIGELAAVYSKLIPVKDSPVIIHCRTGHQASQTFFVLTRLLGYTNVRWYDAGWTEWAARPELPVVSETQKPGGLK